MKTLIKFWAPLLILFLLSPKTINSQVEKRVLKICERTTSSLFSNIDNIVFIKPNNVDYNLANVSYFDLSNKEILTINVVALFYYFKKNFQTASIYKSQIPENLDANTLYVDIEKINIKVFQNTEKLLNYNLKFVLADSNEDEFEVKFDPSNWTKRKRQSWENITYWSHSEKILYDGIANSIFSSFSSDFGGLKILGKKLDNLIDNPSNVCKGNTKNFIGDTEIDNINFREAEKSFIKYWEKNYNNDPLEGIYKQSNYYNLYNRDPDRSGILYGDLYRIAITEDETGEFYNVYYLDNNKMDFNIADLIAKIYKTNESNNYEFEYTDIFLNKADKSKIFRTDRLEFGSYKEPGEERRYRISTKKYDYYEGGSNGYTWRESYKNESNYTIAQRTDGFFIKYNEFDSSFNFDSYFTRSFKPKRIYERSPKSNLKKSTRKTTPKKKSAPPDAKTID